jgi:hypothetical protein
MFEFDLLDITENLEIVKKGDKTIYNTDDVTTGNEWVKPIYNKKELKEVLVFSSPLNYKMRTKQVYRENLGFFIGAGNSVSTNTTHYSIASSPISNNLSSTPLTTDNFIKCCVLFTTRKVVKGDWKNWYDEYIAPNEEHEQFEQFKYDSLVYSLFESKSNQSSLRQVEYKDKLWDIKNEFFWMSKDRMKQLADENGYDNLYNDARTSSDRHVYNLLFGEERIYDKLSDDAKVVLDKATELVEQSMTLRQVMADDYNHLDSWDAGYAQLKLVWKEYFEEDFKEFRQLYKNLEDRMRPLVYELGFLMK